MVVTCPGTRNSGLIPTTLASSATSVRRRRSRSAAGVLVAALLLSVPAEAQVPPAQVQPPPPSSPIPRALPPPPPGLPAVAQPALPARSGPSLPSGPVAVRAVDVEGVTVYPPGAFATLTAGLVGPVVPPGRIEAARAAMQQRYRAGGYVLSSVAVAFDAATGRLRFIVAEGRIAAVKLDGDIGPAATQVLRFLNHLTEPKAIDSATLERYLILAGQVPGVTVHPTLQPSADEPGALTLVAQVARQPVSAELAADNRAWVNTGAIEGVVTASLNSFTEFGERTDVSVYHAFPNSESYAQGSFEVFLGSSGLKLRLYGGAGRVTPTGYLRHENYASDINSFGARLSYPLLLTRRQTLDIFLAGDATDAVVNLGVPNATRFSSDSVRATRIGATYAISDALLGDAFPAVTSVTARLSHGLTAFGSTSNHSATAARAGEDFGFTKFDAQLSRTQTLFEPWQGASVAFFGQISAQYSGDVLPPTEEFFLGGLQYARGYYAGEVIGDKALATTAELQFNTALNLTPLGLAYAVPVQFYGFYDWGEVWSNGANTRSSHLNSVGGGARMHLTRWAEVDLEGVARLNRYPYGNGAGVSPLRGEAFYWQLLLRY